MIKKLLMTTIMALMISGVSYADELRLEASASAKLGNLTLKVEEQVRHDLGVSEEMVTTAAPYEHTVFVATKSVGSTDVSLRVRNTNTAGASTNRLSLDADNDCGVLGLDIHNRLRLQLDNISNIKDVTTKQLALRDRLDVSKTVALAGQDLKLSLADEVFADETGLTINRAIASVGTKVSAVNVTAEYFLQTDQVTSEDRSNSHVVGVYASLSF